MSFGGDKPHFGGSPPFLRHAKSQDTRPHPSQSVLLNDLWEHPRSGNLRESLHEVGIDSGDDEARGRLGNHQEFQA